MKRHSYFFLYAYGLLAFFALFALFFVVSAFLIITPVQAAVPNWQKGVNVLPMTTTDLGSSGMRTSLDNLKKTGASHVTFVVPYYQSNTQTTDIAPGWNTPTDAALISAIDYARSIGLTVGLKVHIEPYSGDWRAYINPSDRTTWFKNYGNYLVRLAEIGEEHGVGLIVIGTELVSMASSEMNSTNTQNWKDLIKRVRDVYSGKLTYGANSNDNSNSQFVNEKKFIGFWGDLDYAGLSVYYNLNTSSNSVDSLKQQWDYWNKNDIQPFQQAVGKPILIQETGYRSVDNAHIDPWNWERGGSPNMTEQANSYEALLSYWNDYSYIAGVYFWHWETNPNAGGTNSTSYTPQNKPAEAVMKKWFTSPSAPTAPPAQAAFSSTGTAQQSVQVGNAVSLSAAVKTSGAASNVIVDIEVYNSAGQKIFQKFYEGQNFSANETRSFTASWTPSAEGTYRMTIGVFNSNWSQAHHWNNNGASISVQKASSPPPQNPPQPTSTPQNPPSGNYATEIWWPANNTAISGVQPFKAMVQGLPISQYKMYWQVDGGTLNEMHDSQQDYPHKEVLVDVSGWTWRTNGPYTINFVSKNSSGATISQKSITIWVQ